MHFNRKLFVLGGIIKILRIILSKKIYIVLKLIYLIVILNICQIDIF